MTITRVSTAGVYTKTVANFASLQVKGADLSKQLSSGVKSDNYVDIGRDLREVINIESSVRSLDGYIGANDVVVARLGIMDSALEQMYEVMASLKQDLIIEQTNPENLELAGLAQTALEQIASNLDVRQGSRYLFSGSKITVPPSGDIRTNTNINSASFDKNLNYYNGDGLNFVAQASESLDIEYGITGDNEAFQNIFAAAHLAIAADTDVGTSKTLKLEESQRLLDEGLEQLLSLRSQMGSDVKSIENFNDQHVKVKTELEIRYSDLLSTDIAAVTIEQSFNQTVLQATLQNFASITRLNLADFL